MNSLSNVNWSFLKSWGLRASVSTPLLSPFFFRRLSSQFSRVQTAKNALNPTETLATQATANVVAIYLKTKTRLRLWSSDYVKNVWTAIDIQRSIDNQHIVRVKEIVFLGVVLDENLNWKSEISHVANKVAKTSGIINKCSFYLKLLYVYCTTP